MIREIKYRLWRALALVCVLASVACSAEMNGDMYMPDAEKPDYITAFGTLILEKMCVEADNGTTLHIAELGNQTSVEDVETHQGRVLINYTILGNNYEGGFNIRLNRFYKLEVKDMELFDASSEESRSPGHIDEDWLDEDFVSLLEAPVMPYEVSIGGGYVNVNVCYTSSEEDVPDVDLCYDVASSTSDTAVMQLVGEEEDSMFDEGAKTRFRWFSFRIVEDVVPLIGDAHIYAFYWCWWAEEGRPEAGVKEYTSVMNIDSYGSMDKVSRLMAFEN